MEGMEGRQGREKGGKVRSAQEEGSKCRKKMEKRKRRVG